jgi:hypothetical protein
MKQYSRLFTFGCSFTNHHWPTWANIMAYELNVPLYNYGRSGAGNHYIFNSLIQADNFFNFTNDDLIMICWSNISREDRYKNEDWITPGNIYTQNVYDKSFIEKYADSNFFALRDFALIKASFNFLKNIGCDYFMFKMAEFDVLDTFSNIKIPIKYKQILHTYKPWLDKVAPSFFKILWNNDINNKFQQEKVDIGNNMKDGHPYLTEHLEYLKSVLNFKFSEKTNSIVNIYHEKIILRLKEESKNVKNIEAWKMDWKDYYFNNSYKIKIF